MKITTLAWRLRTRTSMTLLAASALIGGAAAITPHLTAHHPVTQIQRVDDSTTGGSTAQPIPQVNSPLVSGGISVIPNPGGKISPGSPGILGTGSSSSGEGDPNDPLTWPTADPENPPWEPGDDPAILDPQFPDRQTGDVPQEWGEFPVPSPSIPQQN